MKLLLSSLLLALFCARSSWSVSSPGSPAVTQSPDVSVQEGGTVDIGCCWTLNLGRMRVYWLKNQTDIKNEIFYLNNCSHGSLLNDTSCCSHWTFTNVTRADSGRYICNVTVDVPLLVTVVGNGTVITVTARDNTKDNTAVEVRGLIFVLRFMLVLALFITFFCINSFATKAQQHTPAAPGIQRTSAQRREENREEEERDER